MKKLIFIKLRRKTKERFFLACFMLLSGINVAFADTPFADSLLNSQLKAFSSFLKQNRNEEISGKSHTSHYVFLALPFTQTITDKAANGGAAYFNKDSDAYKEMAGKIDVFNTAPANEQAPNYIHKDVRFFVCTGRYYLPRSSFLSNAVADDAELTKLLNSSDVNIKESLKKTFDGIKNGYLDALNKDVSYKNFKKIVYFNFEFVWTSMAIARAVGTPSDPSFDSNLYRIRFLVVDNSITSSPSWQWPAIEEKLGLEIQTNENISDDVSREVITYLDSWKTTLVNSTGTVNDGAVNRAASVVNFARSVSEQTIREALQKVDATRNTTSVGMRLFITDNGTTATERSDLKNQIDKRNPKDVIAVLEFDAFGKPKPLDYYFGSDYNELNAFQRTVKGAFQNLGVSPSNLNPLTAFLDGVAYLVGKLAIPERFYNPEVLKEEYNSTIADIFYYVSGANPSSVLIQAIIDPIPGVESGKNAKQAKHKVELAFYCGIWNGLVNQVKGLPDLATWAVKMITNETNTKGLGTRDDFVSQWDNFKADCEQKNNSVTYGGCVWDMMWSQMRKAHTTGGACYISSQIGGDVANLATFFIAFAKVGSIAKIASVMETLDITTYVFKGASLLLRYSLPNIKLAFYLGKATTYLIIKTAGNSAEVVFDIMKAGALDIERVLNNSLDNLINKPKYAIIEQGDRLIFGIDQFPSGGQIEDILDNAGQKIQDAYGNYLSQIKDAGGNYQLAITKVKGGGSVLDLLSKIKTTLKQELGWTDELITAFEIDFKNNKDLLKKFDNGELDPNSWKILNEAGVSNPKRIAPEILASMGKHIKDSDFLLKLGGTLEAGKAKYAEIIKEYTGKCSTCGNFGYKNLPNSPDIYLDQIYAYTKKFGGNNIEGFDVPSFKNQPYSQDGFLHMMNHLTTEVDASKIKKMDMTFEDELGNSLPCRNGAGTSCFDVQMKDGEVPRFYEYKSIESFTNFNINQFKAYLQNISSLSELRYVFKASKLTTEQAKDGMKAFLKNNAELFFNTNKSLFQKLDKFDGSGKIKDWEDLYNLANSNIADNSLVLFVESI